MKEKARITLIVAAFILVAVLHFSCDGQQVTNTTGGKTESIFPKSELGLASNFTGKAWNIGLVANDTICNTVNSLFL